MKRPRHFVRTGLLDPGGRIFGKGESHGLAGPLCQSQEKLGGIVRLNRRHFCARRAGLARAGAQTEYQREHIFWLSPELIRI